jgi:hypothetical protein
MLKFLEGSRKDVSATHRPLVDSIGVFFQHARSVDALRIPICVGITFHFTAHSLSRLLKCKPATTVCDPEVNR